MINLKNIRFVQVCTKKSRFLSKNEYSKIPIMADIEYEKQIPIVCPDCDNEINEDETFCLICGKRI